MVRTENSTHSSQHREKSLQHSHTDVNTTLLIEKAPRELLSLFCGCGGLDLGFERAGFATALAYDQRKDAVSSWNRNRTKNVAKVQDIRELGLETLDEHYGKTFTPSAIIGGPPCQGFSLANRQGNANDPRNSLVSTFIEIALALHARSPIDFIAMENVPAICGVRGGNVVDRLVEKLEENGFRVNQAILDAVDFNVPQHRRRFFLVAINSRRHVDAEWHKPERCADQFTVRDAIGNLPPPTFFSRGIDPSGIPHHENHWCMTPKSSKFSDGSLFEGYRASRSFQTLSWDKPSYTASYGNREMHVHPNAKRRLSIYEAMRIQGFPSEFVLNGSLSSQTTQVSEAVPPPLAEAVAASIRKAIGD